MSQTNIAEKEENTMDVITAQEATEILRGEGMKINPETVRLGILQGQFPWGNIIMDGERVRSCWIYKEPLMRWIEERK